MAIHPLHSLTDQCFSCATQTPPLLLVSTVTLILTVTGICLLTCSQKSSKPSAKVWSLSATEGVTVPKAVVGLNRLEKSLDVNCLGTAVGSEQGAYARKLPQPPPDICQYALAG